MSSVNVNRACKSVGPSNLTGELMTVSNTNTERSRPWAGVLPPFCYRQLFDACERTWMQEPGKKVLGQGVRIAGLVQQAVTGSRQGYRPENGSPCSGSVSGNY